MEDVGDAFHFKDEDIHYNPVKKEPKVTAEATLTNGADEGAAVCSIPNRSKDHDARPSNVKVHPYIQLHLAFLAEKRGRARCEAKKTKWKRQALRKGRACARLTAAVFQMNDLMKTKQRPAAEITTNDEDSSSNETGNDGPVSDKVDDDDFSMDKKLSLIHI